jgi:LCP family protein required for cell wall assembly
LWFKKTIFVLLFLIIFGGAGLAAYVFKTTHNIFVGKNNSFFHQVQSLLSGGVGQSKLIGENDDQINILLLGIGGEGHDGPYLTDTIIVAQIKPSTQNVVLTAIPRDFLVESKTLGSTKINALFSDGFTKNNKNWDDAGQEITDEVEKLSGLKIPYFAVLDFSGFEKAVDEVGGLDIKIDQTFTDYTYPDNGTGYLPPVTFKEGMEHMNGARALIFARSRHANSNEGSDFARSKRQQKVMTAFKEKLVALNLIKDSSSLQNLLNIFASHFHTNINPGELLHLYALTKDYPKSNILSVNVSPESGLLCDLILPDTGAYVLVPCAGKSELDIQYLFAHAFWIGKLKAEQSTVLLAEISNNKTTIQAAERILSTYGINPIRTTVPAGLFTQTSVATLTPNKPDTDYFLKTSFGATELASLPSGFVISDTLKNLNPNFLLVLTPDSELLKLPSSSGTSIYDKYRLRAASSTKESSATTSPTSKIIIPTTTTSTLKTTLHLTATTTLKSTATTTKKTLK